MSSNCEHVLLTQECIEIVIHKDDNIVTIYDDTVTPQADAFTPLVAQAIAPDPSTTNLWSDTTDNTLYFHDGTHWVSQEQHKLSWGRQGTLTAAFLGKEGSDWPYHGGDAFHTDTKVSFVIVSFGTPELGLLELRYSQGSLANEVLYNTTDANSLMTTSSFALDASTAHVIPANTQIFAHWLSTLTPAKDLHIEVFFRRVYQ